MCLNRRNKKKYKLSSAVFCVEKEAEPHRRKNTHFVVVVGGGC
jgi:hypothetical protein